MTIDAAGLVTPAQRDALEERLRGRKPRPIIPVAAAMDAAPVSFEQQSIFIDGKLRADAATYNRPCIYRLSGDLDRAALERSLHAIVDRHSVLKSKIVSRAGQIQESIDRELAVDLPFHDFSWFVEPETAAWGEIHQSSRQPFELELVPPFRFSLLRISDREHLFLATFHHVVFDAASETVFGKELAAHYEAFHTGALPALATLPIQYRDYAVWQHAQETDRPSRADRSIEFWKRVLESMPPAGAADDSGTNADRPPPPPTEFCIGPALLAQIRRLCREQSTTPFMLMLAVFGILLDRYTGGRDFVAGCPLSRRNRPELEPLIGVFIDTKPFAIHVEPAEPFLQHLARVREAWIEVLSHDDVTLQQLTASGALKRASGASSLFDFFLVYEPFDDTLLHSAGLEIRSERARTPAPAARCVLEMADTGDRITGTMHCGLHQFQGSTSDRVVAQFLRLLEGVVYDPRVIIRDLPLLTQDERATLLTVWNDTDASYPSDKCLHQLFEEQVDRTPEAVAVVDNAEQLSYLELNERADRLADFLKGQGVAADVPVGLHGDRSIGTLVGLLGILKAGGAYVPLPLGVPLSRYLAIAEDSKLRLVVASHAGIDVPEADFYRVVSAGCAEIDQPSLPGPRNSNGPRPENLACILYTSGSTGAPKGVGVEHRGLVNLMTHRLTRQFAPAHFQVAALTSPITFDASITQIFSPLFTGGTLVITTGVEELLASQWYDRLTAFTGAATVISDLAERRRLPASVRVVAVGGEPVPARLVELVRAHPTALRLDVLYGLTECSGYSTTAALVDRLHPDEEKLTDLASEDHLRDLRLIGRPIANTQVYVLDETLEPVPIGVAGELYIGGIGVTRGFLGDPELTARRFIANPFIAGARVQRTGDVVRWRWDGQLEFLGRIDQQVKLRGNRIELGEIESVLCTHSQVSSCAVMLREDQPGDQQLVAYFVPRPGMEPQLSELRSYLRERLPAYMVPSTFMTLSTLPLTSNGKVDRRALPPPDDTPASLSSEYVSPRNAIEEQLAAIWAELLRIPRVGVHENFFDLGGHSLLAIELFARIETAFQKRLPLAHLFRHATVAALAALLAEPERAVAAVVVMELQRGDPGRPALFLLPNVVGDLFCNHQLVRSLGPGTPVYGFQPNLTHGAGEATLSFEAVVALHVRALVEFQPQGPYALAGYSYAGAMAYEMACQLAQRGAKVDLLVILDTRPNLRKKDRGRGWHVRTALARLRNLPFWIRNQALATAPADLRKRAATRLRFLARRCYRRLRGQSGLAEFQEILDVQGIPTHGSEQMASFCRAYQLYRAGPYPGRVTLIRGRTQPFVCAPEFDLGWGRVASGGVDARVVNGCHHNILYHPNVERVAFELNQALGARSQSSSSSD